MNSLALTAISFYVTLIHIMRREDCEWETIDDLIELVSAAALEAARRSAEAIVQIFNVQVFLSPMLSRDEWRRKDRTIKCLHTSIGDLYLQRDTYQHKRTGRCVALLFEGLGITPHQRTSRERMYRVLDLCPEMSFRKAILATGAQVCVQTAINWLRDKMPMLERMVKGAPRKAEVLHVFSGEDHLAMRKRPEAQTHDSAGRCCRGRAHSGAQRAIPPRSSLLFPQSGSDDTEPDGYYFRIYLCRV